MISSNIAPPPLSLLSSSPNKFSVDLQSYPNTKQRRCSVLCSGVRTAAKRQSRDLSATEARVSLVLALASQASSVSQRRKCSVFSLILNCYVTVKLCVFVLVLADLAVETAKYAFPKRFNSSNLEEAFMSG